MYNVQMPDWTAGMGRSVRVFMYDCVYGGMGQAACTCIKRVTDSEAVNSVARTCLIKQDHASCEWWTHSRS